MTLGQFQAYVNTLGLELQVVYDAADRLVKACPAANTADEDFQVAAEVRDVFWQRAIEYYARRKE